MSRVPEKRTQDGPVIINNDYPRIPSDIKSQLKSRRIREDRRNVNEIFIF